MYAILWKFKTDSRLRQGREDLIQGHIFIGLPKHNAISMARKRFEFPICIVQAHIF